MGDKFYNLINKGNGSAELFIYGEIVSGDKWDSTDVTITDFKEQLDALDYSVTTLNIFCNSPGGSVFTAVNMVNLLDRVKNRMTINAYVDGVAASASSFFIMKAHNIYMYQNSFLMIHKPMLGLLFSPNATVLREKADWLDQVEQATCIPAYMSKATDALTEEKLTKMLEDETWLNASEASQYFNINILDEVKDAVACVDVDLFNTYKNVPKQLVPQQNMTISVEEMALRQRIADEAKANSDYLNTILGGI
ncbi:head maturation protease, ClpP-related [Bacillus cihuensis]|uniref:head maturation protease, ClpP-related n=1 Tax=Bacillus cihuensis TaxID=1208599 RepID=UPI00042A05F0|nr:head maturation protease, ClpP-related [Bacillus cihuensis]